MKTGKRFRRDLLEWSNTSIREFPWREQEASLYTVFISEFFLSRTRANVVARVIPEFLNEFPDMNAIREADVEKIAKVIRPMGMQHRRTAALKEMAEMLGERNIPRDRDKIQELPRVGEYVANATLCFGLGEPIYIKDTNVERIFSRLLGEEWPEEPDEQVDYLDLLVPPEKARRYNLALLDFGSEICTARSPRCDDCFASPYCSYFEEVEAT